MSIPRGFLHATASMVQRRTAQGRLHATKKKRNVNVRPSAHHNYNRHEQQMWISNATTTRTKSRGDIGLNDIYKLKVFRLHDRSLYPLSVALNCSANRYIAGPGVQPDTSARCVSAPCAREVYMHASVNAFRLVMKRSLPYLSVYQIDQIDHPWRLFTIYLPIRATCLLSSAEIQFKMLPR